MLYYISMLSTTGGKLKVSPKTILKNYDKIKKYAPKIIEGINRLKDWSNN